MSFKKKPIHAKSKLASVLALSLVVILQGCFGLTSDDAGDDSGTDDGVAVSVESLGLAVAATGAHMESAMAQLLARIRDTMASRARELRRAAANGRVDLGQAPRSTLEMVPVDITKQPDGMSCSLDVDNVNSTLMELSCMTSEDLTSSCGDDSVTLSAGFTFGLLTDDTGGFRLTMSGDVTGGEMSESTGFQCELYAAAGESEGDSEFVRT